VDWEILLNRQLKSEIIFTFKIRISEKKRITFKKYFSQVEMTGVIRQFLAVLEAGLGRGLRGREVGRAEWGPASGAGFQPTSSLGS
jgi:hypothetical protein